MIIYLKDTIKNITSSLDSVVIIGNFDGLHLGHKLLIQIAKKESRFYNRLIILYSFFPNTLKVFNEYKKLYLIQNYYKKYNILFQIGIDLIIIEHFYKQFFKISSISFINNILIRQLNAKSIIIRKGFRFGRFESGDSFLIKYLLKKNHSVLYLQKHLLINQTRCSSTHIRKFIAIGSLINVFNFIGYHFHLNSIVCIGSKLGRTIYIPTINISSPNHIYPSPGVYFTYINIVKYKKKYISITNIGYRPTIKKQYSKYLTIETHIIQNDTYITNIYNNKIILFFIKKIREEKKFNNITDLKYAIKNDIVFIKKYLFKKFMYK